MRMYWNHFPRKKKKFRKNVFKAEYPGTFNWLKAVYKKERIFQPKRKLNDERL